MHGPDVIVLVDKPAGSTSFRTLDVIKRTLGTRRVGHAGTLDSFAEGLLVVAAGAFTRLLPLFLALDKTYRAVFEFGRETDTLDPQGELIGMAAVPGIETVTAALDAFRGSIQQRPPEDSAVHVDGHRAHKLARSGQAPVLEPRQVEIHSLRVLDWTAPFLSLEIVCSKGTYIRALARDLGLACASRAHVRELSRSAIGAFRLQDAVVPERAAGTAGARPVRWFLERIPELALISVDRSVRERFLNGARLDEKDLPMAAATGRTAVFFEDDDSLLGLVSRTGGRFVYDVVTGRR